MTDTTLRDRIAAVQAKHLLVRYDRAAWWCQCGDDCLSVEGSHSLHVADAVIEALPELNPDHIRRKYLKDWEEGYDEGYSAGGGGC